MEKHPIVIFYSALRYFLLFWPYANLTSYCS